MAHVQGRRRKPAAIPQSAEKENRAPAKGKKTVSINGMFDHVKKHQQPHENRSVLSPRPAGITKPKAKPGFFSTAMKAATPSKPGQVAQPGFFAKFLANATASPSKMGFADPVADYRDAATANFEERMAQWRKELDQRRNGLNTDGKPIRKAPVPTRAEIDALNKELEEVLKPLDDEILHVETQAGIKTQRLGETMAMLQKRERNKKAQIEELMQEQEQIDAEIGRLKKEIQGEGEATVTIKREYEAQVVALQKEMEKVDAKAKTELDEMKRKDRETKKAFNRKVQALWDGMHDED